MQHSGDGGERSSERADATAGIRGETALTLEDFTAAWLHLPQVRTGLTTVAVWIVATPILALAIPYVNSRSGPEPFETPRIAALFPGLVACLLGYRFWRGRKRFAEDALSDTRGAEGVSFRFDREGVTFDAPGRNVRVSWAVIPRAIETNEAFIVYASQASLVVAPKRAFASADLARIASLTRERVTPRELRGADFRPLRKLLLWLVLLGVSFAIWQLLGQK